MTDSHGSPPDDEPKTPMWLPALGAALFVGVALWWAVTPSALPIAPAEDAASASASVAPPPATPPPQAAHAAIPAGGPRAAPSGMKLDPKIEERMRKLHEGMVPGGPGRHP
jgi:hypothetical protein